MILQKSDLYTVTGLQVTDTTIRAELSIDPQHRIFEGHFPGRPVVPGVCMLEMIKEIAQGSLRKKLFLTKATQVKYLKVLVPEQNARIALHIKWKGDLCFDADLQEQGQTIMKMSGQFALTCE